MIQPPQPDYTVRVGLGFSGPADVKVGFHSNKNWLTVVAANRPVAGIKDPHGPHLINVLHQSIMAALQKHRANPRAVVVSITVQSTDVCRAITPPADSTSVAFSCPEDPRRITVVTPGDADGTGARGPGEKVVNRALNEAQRLLAEAGADAVQATVEVFVISTKPVVRLPARTVRKAPVPIDLDIAEDGGGATT